MSRDNSEIVVIVEPGACGFHATIKARKSDGKNVTIEILESKCKQIQKLSQNIEKISLKDLFMPITSNPVYVACKQAGCHASCVIPVAVIKAAEAALGLALSKDISIKFQS
ncbi:MAG: hypothetical protein PVI90_01860 [Desulfobacteraceae bacterium]|jgi:hypothetical protein